MYISRDEAVFDIPFDVGPTTAKQALASLFGDAQIDTLVKKFDFSKINVKDNSRQDHLSVWLAPSYGDLTSASVQQLDDGLKVMLVETIKTLSYIPPARRTWDAIMSAMMQCSFIEPLDVTITRTDKLIKSGTNVFKFDGSPDAAIVREVESWFLRLINDKDVLDRTMIDVKVLADIVAQTGATVDSFEHLFFRDETHEKTLVDIGVLRFPDLNHPYFQVYRIQLTAWSHSKRILMVQEDNNGIIGEYSSCKFKPCDSVIKQMSEQATDTAAKEADSMFEEVDERARRKAIMEKADHMFRPVDYTTIRIM